MRFIIAERYHNQSFNNEIEKEISMVFESAEVEQSVIEMDLQYEIELEKFFRGDLEMTKNTNDGTIMQTSLDFISNSNEVHKLDNYKPNHIDNNEKLQEESLSMNLTEVIPIEADKALSNETPSEESFDKNPNLEIDNEINIDENTFSVQTNESEEFGDVQEVISEGLYVNENIDELVSNESIKHEVIPEDKIHSDDSDVEVLTSPIVMGEINENDSQSMEMEINNKIDIETKEILTSTTNEDLELNNNINENVEVENINDVENNDDVIETSEHSSTNIIIKSESNSKVNDKIENGNNDDLLLAKIVGKILSEEIKTNKDFNKAIKGYWVFKNGKTDRDLLDAIRSGKINDSEHDPNVVLNNIKKLLKKIN